jgi:hypothetical protein
MGFARLSTQTVIDSFESFTLAPNSFYKDTNNAPFQNSSAVFTHEWVKGNFPFWSAGFSYTNKTDSSNGTYTNLYGVIPFKGFGSSDTYVVGQDKGIIRLKNKQTAINGFYYTNTTYAYKSMRNGDGFARKFGDTTGTKSGTTIAQGDYPDFFKLVVRGYQNGNLKPDSIEIWLADYRFSNKTQDYIVSDWRFANTSALGLVDSIQFIQRSSVYNQYGMLTPGFFALDNFETGPANLVGIQFQGSAKSLSIYPLPVKDLLTVKNEGTFNFQVLNCEGKLIANGSGQDLVSIDLSGLSTGLYVLQIQANGQQMSKKISKE